jgi:hypothetical protein
MFPLAGAITLTANPWAVVVHLIKMGIMQMLLLV